MDGNRSLGKVCPQRRDSGVGEININRVELINAFPLFLQKFFEPWKRLKSTQACIGCCSYCSLHCSFTPSSPVGNTWPWSFLLCARFSCWRWILSDHTILYYTKKPLLPVGLFYSTIVDCYYFSMKIDCFSLTATFFSSRTAGVQTGIFSNASTRW